MFLCRSAREPRPQADEGEVPSKSLSSMRETFSRGLALMDWVMCPLDLSRWIERVGWSYHYRFNQPLNLEHAVDHQPIRIP